MNLPKIKLTKVEELSDALHSNNIVTGFSIEGFKTSDPIIGEPFWVGNEWRTSPVTEIVSPTKFKTYNSIYEIEYL